MLYTTCIIDNLVAVFEEVDAWYCSQYFRSNGMTERNRRFITISYNSRLIPDSWCYITGIELFVDGGLAQI
ncbi:MAG: hypothetical protein WBE68_12440 [Candidatus Nitrosopolaris sp.]